VVGCECFGDDLSVRLVGVFLWIIQEEKDVGNRD
jgi:hypothetical protein